MAFETMRFLKALARSFSRRDGLDELSRGADRRAFIRALGETDVTVFAALTDEGLDPETLTPELLYAHIEKGARESSESTGFEPFVYEVNGRRRLPFFTTLDLAKKFGGEYSRERNRVFGFNGLGIKASTLARLAPLCDVLVMNDKSGKALELTAEDGRLLQEMWG
jgi:hypothetical protein